MEDDSFTFRVQLAVMLSIFLCALLGNGLFLVSMITRKKRTLSDQIIMNLALCDLTVVLTGIPLQLVEAGIGYFPLGETGCRIFYPLSTLAVTSVAITLLFLSFERFIAVLHPYQYNRLKQYPLTFISLCHFISFCFVLPYVIILKLVNRNGLPQCVETWSIGAGSAYTMMLFLIQYGIPLSIMCIFYLLTCLELKRKNDRFILVSEDNSSAHQGGGKKRNFVYVESTNVNGKYKHSLENNKKTKKVKTTTGRWRSSSMYQKTVGRRRSSSVYRKNVYCRKRQKQNNSILKLFVSIVVIFALFMIPNQITWLFEAFREGKMSKKWIFVAYSLTYMNSVVNPLLYGFNSKFRKYYKRVFLLSCLMQKRDTSEVEHD